MAIVNRFNVNKEQVTLDADIIENMSANDVPYDASTQYDENTVGEKLSELGQQVIYDVTANNDGAVFTSLSALLSSENLSTLIPSTVRCSGMSIRFLQSSDNTYAQYRYMSTAVDGETNSFINTDNWSFCGDDVLFENPEYINVKTDAEGRILWAIKADGTSYIGDGLQVEGNATVRGNLDLTNESLESSDDSKYLKVTTDALGRIIDGIKKDGSHYIYNVQSESIDALRDEKVSKEGGKGLSTNDYTDAEKELVAVHEIVDSPEYIKAEVDSEGKILSYRKVDGTKVEKKLEVEDVTFVGEAKKQLDRNIAKTEKVRDWHLPKYGYIDFVEEIFYLTANEGYSDKNGIFPMQVREDTYYSSTPLYKYYVKSTLTDNDDGTFSINEDSVALDFYVPSSILSINDVPYVKATLTEVVGTEPDVVTYSVNENSVRVTKIVDSPCVGTWAINKNDQHYIKINVDFGSYLNGTHYAQVKYQGNTTLYIRKRNFRITFYKKSDYKKKDKIKIGEMLRLSGFNMKSEFRDSSRVKELVIYRLIRDIYEHRDVYDRYPWYKDNTPWCGATGTINGFNVGLKIGGELYGIYYFALKKDEKNYMLDGDNPLSGAFVQAYPQYYPDGYSTFWTSFVAGCWEDEMNDDKPQEVDTALSSLYDFINGDSFDKEHIPERMSVIDWIDYFIIGQVFVLRDNYINNVILYSDSNMQKWYPYIYDLDNALANNSSDASINALYNQYVESTGTGADVSIWEKLKDIYWDEIVNRYAELRNTVLNTNRVLESISSISDIPNDDVYLENTKWDTNVTSGIKEFKDGIQKRLKYLDNNYFI